MRLSEDVEVEKEGGMADLAEEGDGKVIEGLGEIVGDGTEDGFERVDEVVLESVHVGSGLGDSEAAEMGVAIQDVTSKDSRRTSIEGATESHLAEQNGRGNRVVLL